MKTATPILHAVVIALSASGLWATPPGLIPNPSFESPIGQNDSDNWTLLPYGHQITRDLEEKVHGSASLRFTSNGQNLTSSISWNLDPGVSQKYPLRLTGSVQTEQLKGGASLYVLADLGSGDRYYDYMADRLTTGTTDWTSLDLAIPALDAKNVRVGVLVWGDGVARFDDLALAPIDVSSPSSGDAKAYLENALELMQQHSIVRESVDWERLRRTAIALSAGSQTTQDTYPAIAVAIKLLGDNHSRLFTPKQSRAIRGDGTDSSLRLDWTQPASRLLDERTAYLSVTTFGGTHTGRTTQYADQVQQAIKSVDSSNVCGWVVDLRNNGGGNVFPMLAGVGPLLGNGNAGGGITVDGNLIRRHYEDGRSGSATISITPHTLSNDKPPIAVLIGPKTASSGEATALAFIGRPRVRTFGRPTAGLTTGNAPYKLGDGAVLNLAITKMVDAAGNVYGSKIEPDVVIQSEDEVLVEAQRWIGRECDSRASARDQTTRRSLNLEVHTP